ncbi:hypothetical protein INS49_014310 [Diaporthe citri]|uniref:uncharacterized protein n=1 Tax=Diaporthe citri TaxID=83186 RepID=UPI001C7FC19A|nr:uncharacterized protein INS49_014310 [Diaporthe citri]KAG6358426.1 hypothetical protein INS49_014310 [Diaporthe citri]
MVDQIRLMEMKLQWRESWVALGYRMSGSHQTTPWTTGRGDEARPAVQAWAAGASGEPTAK